MCYSFCCVLRLRLNISPDELRLTPPFHVNSNSIAMHCPLCKTRLKKNLLLSSLAILICPNEACVYPFNLTMPQIQQKRLVIHVTESEILSLMADKFSQAGVDSKIQQFLMKYDPDVMD